MKPQIKDYLQVRNDKAVELDDDSKVAFTFSKDFEKIYLKISATKSSYASVICPLLRDYEDANYRYISYEVVQIFTNAVKGLRDVLPSLNTEAEKLEAAMLFFSSIEGRDLLTYIRDYNMNEMYLESSKQVKEFEDGKFEKSLDQSCFFLENK